MSTYTPESVLASWVREFHICGDFPDEVSIVFDGYAETEDGEEDQSQLCYAVFIHKDSGKDGFVFPDHDQYGNVICHRPDQEATYYVWVNEEGECDCISDGSSDLDIKIFEKLIVALEKRYQEG